MTLLWSVLKGLGLMVLGAVIGLWLLERAFRSSWRPPW